MYGKQCGRRDSTRSSQLSWAYDCKGIVASRQMSWHSDCSCLSESRSAPPLKFRVATAFRPILPAGTLWLLNTASLMQWCAICIGRIECGTVPHQNSLTCVRLGGSVRGKRVSVSEPDSAHGSISMEIMIR